MTGELPASIRDQIELALTEAIQSSVGVEVVEEFVIAAMAARYAYHAMTQTNSSVTAVPPQVAQAIITQMMASYSSLTGFAMAKERHTNLDDMQHFSVGR
jgi:ribosomal protein RSM22 (predicted rRNA methylase)